MNAPLTTTQSGVLPLKVLIACEFSGTVRRAFRALGHDAWSCDLLPAEDGDPHHYQCDVRSLDLSLYSVLVGHPTCTFLTNAAVRHLHSIPSKRGTLPAVHGEKRWQAMRESAELFRYLLNAPVPQIAIENPIPHRYAVEEIGRKYDQIIQPWQFGHGETKATCLWLKGLPALLPTNIVAGREARIHKMSPGPDRWKERSRTFTGIAQAMAEQWGGKAN